MKYLFILSLFLVNLFGNSIQGFSDLKLNNLSEKNIKEEKIIYKDMLAYLANSNDNSQFLVLGILYANGTDIADSTGATIKPNPILAEKYLLKSAKSNIRAYSVLGGLYLLNENMSKFDKDLNLSEKYIKKGFYSGDQEAGTLLSKLYFKQNKYEKGLNLLFDLANKNDSSAQLALALLFKSGLFTNNGKELININMKTAEHYLTLACTNEKKSDNVQKICFDSNLVSMSKN